MIIKEERIGGQRLILGDCRTVLPLLQRFDAIVSDPPYLLTSGGKNTGEMKGLFAHDRYDNAGALFAMVGWPEMAAVFRAAAMPDCEVIVMANDRNIADAELAFRAEGFGFHRTLVWDKCSVTPNRWFMQGAEFGLYLWRGRARPINDCAAHPIIKLPQRDVSDHPTEKPVALMRRWIELITAPEFSVLDPFMGSGTTLVACEAAGRSGTGIEIDPHHFATACRRVDEATRQPDMFIAPPAPQPTQEGFDI